MDFYASFCEGVYALMGIDLQCYKRAQMERRLTVLRNKEGYSTFDAYLQALRIHPALRANLLDRMTINVSEFFRNPERWAALLPVLRSLNKESITVWSAACSTGEEPYTVAILLTEFKQPKFRILATDIDLQVLAAAKAALYKPHQLQWVPKDIRERYFVQMNDQFMVRQEVSQHVDFQPHNLLADDYPTGIDLIICRNVLIYFTDAAKQFVIKRFSNSLNDGGILFVGSTEQFFRSSLYQLESIGPFLYQRKG